MSDVSRRTLLKSGAVALAAVGAPSIVRAEVQPDWQSLTAAYQVPDWFRDAKFGMWAHWGVQCVPEFGDWYGRQMYIQGNPYYEHHLKTYGHPADLGFIELIGRWKAENWDPEHLVRLYRKAGARYFMTMACHHDNFDNFDSAHHAWNATRVGPKRDIVGTWEKVVRDAGLRFAISNHSSHAWHWWQTAYGYDAEGPRRGQRYDAFRLRKADGRGHYWDGLDPQDLYTGPNFAPPDGIRSIKAMNDWHGARDGQWIESPPPGRPDIVRNWLLRQMDLVEKYRPDMIYFDDTRIPYGRAGLEAVAHFYNQSIKWHGRIDAVLTAKQLTDFQRHAIVEDVERGWVSDIRPVAWQTDTCIGNWHYDRRLFETHGYKSGKEVVQRLCDVVSKNGNLMLNIPVRPDGTIDSDEEKVVADITDWMAVNADAIHASRPWRRFGEGPTKPPEGMLNEGQAKPFTAADIRFTVKKGVLHAFFLEAPPSGPADIASLGRTSLGAAVIERVELQSGQPVEFRQDEATLRLDLPGGTGTAVVPGVRIMGRGIA